MKVKLCGFTNQETIDLAVKLGVDFIGLVFYQPSPRNIEPEKAAQIITNIPKSVKKVAVVVDASDDKIAQIIEYFGPDLLQLHGQETPQRVAEIKKKFSLATIKALAIHDTTSLVKIKDYEDAVDYFLFDAKTPGSGQSFDWEILKNLNIKKDFFLSGGLNIENIDEALKTTQAQIIDLSSGIEEIKGLKSPKLIQEFMQKISILKKSYE